MLIGRTLKVDAHEKPLTQIVTELSAVEDVALLVDEPAAELDSEHLEQLVNVLIKPGVQLFLTALEAEALPLNSQPTLFHVKHGELSTLL